MHHHSYRRLMTRCHFAAESGGPNSCGKPDLTLIEGETVHGVARRHNISRSTLFCWRTDRLIADNEATLRQEVLDIPLAYYRVNLR
jgi:Transposase